MQENVAKTAPEWVFVARSVAQLPDAQEVALRCMARADMAAQDGTDWLIVSEAWAQDFNDSEMAWQCLAKAESLAVGSNAREQVADDWEESTDNQGMTDSLANSPGAEPEDANSDYPGEPAFYEPGIPPWIIGHRKLLGYSAKVILMEQMTSWRKQNQWQAPA